MTQITSSDKSEENNFYQELDKKRAHKSCCTCQTITILFTVLFLVVIGGVYYLYFLATHGGILNAPPKTANSWVDFNTKISTTSPDDAGFATVVLTTEEVNILLSQGLSTGQFVMKDVHTSINPDAMLVYGTLTKPLRSKVVLTIVPTVENGEVKMTVTQASAGKLNLPFFWLDNISKIMSGVLAEKMSALYKNFEVRTIVLEENQMSIYLKSRGESNN